VTVHVLGNVEAVPVHDRTVGDLVVEDDPDSLALTKAERGPEIGTLDHRDRSGVSLRHLGNVSPYIGIDSGSDRDRVANRPQRYLDVDRATGE